MRAWTGRLIASLLLLSGCTTMEAIDFRDNEPRLVLEEYFSGSTTAWGLFEDRFGTVRRQFVVDITGTWDGETIVLDEHFTYSDGELDRRVWRIRKIDEHRYEGTADDVVGIAYGETYGNALNFRYDVDLQIGGRTVRVHFDDWMFLQPSDVLINRARVSKFGIEIGEVTLVFMKGDDDADGSAPSADRQPSAQPLHQ